VSLPDTGNMAKLHRESRAPDGAFIDNPSFPAWDRPINRRLYGSREEQIQGAALRARGCPTPKPADDKVSRRRRQVAPVAVPARAPMPDAFRAENLRREWESTVAEVRRLKADGQPYRATADRARELRTRLVALNGGVARREIAVAQSSESNPVKAN
jgi:hypothetical protein